MPNRLIDEYHDDDLKAMDQVMNEAGAAILFEKDIDDSINEIEKHETRDRHLGNRPF